MSFIRGASGQSVGAQMINAADGSAFTGATTIYITGDGGTQAIGTVSGGLCVHEGQGYHSYSPSASEANYAQIAFTFVGTGAINQTIQIFTEGGTPTAAPVATASALNLITCADLISRALKRLRVVGAGALPTADDQADAFDRLCSMLRSWSLQRGTIWQIVRTTWTIVANTTSYTVGPGGTVNIRRPASPQAIDRIGFIDTSVTPNLEYPGSAPLTEDQYGDIRQRTQTNTFPAGWYYTPTVPLGTLTPFPVPTSSSLLGVIYVPTPVTIPSAVTDQIVLPDGMDLAIQENLAVLLAPEFGVEVTADLRQSARESKAWVTTSNLRMVDMDTSAVACLFGTGRSSENVYTGS